jgi:Family of unknown function (DUF6535)
LLPDSAGNTVLLLTQISQQLDGLANGDRANIPSSSSLQSTIANWKPPTSAVWVNVLWFLSLVISLFCALLATLQQRWARRYLWNTQPHLAIHKRALIRSFFAEGVTRFHLAIAVEAIPALLHLSVFLFLAGLVISLFNIHHTVAYVILVSSVACVVVYAAITVMPAIFHNSPYTSPFSAAVWYASRKTALALLKAVDHIAELVRKHSGFGKKPTTTLPLSGGAPPSKLSLFKARLSRDMTKAANYVALASDKGMIARALGWTLDKLDEEGEMVQFAAGIPGFSRSIGVKDAVSILEQTKKYSTLHRSLWRDITSLLIRSAKPGLLPDSKLLPESVRQERIKICLQALYFFPHAMQKILHRAADQLHNKKVIVSFVPLLQSVDSWLIAERLSKPNRRIHQDVTIAARCVAAVLATQMPNEQTEPIVMQQLKIADRDTLYRLARPGDNLLLKNLNNLLENTALEYIEMDPEKFPIIVSAACLVMKMLRFPKTQQELRGEYVRLLTRIESYASGSSSSENAIMNAKKLLSALPGYPLDPVAPADDTSTTTVLTTLRTPGDSPPGPLQPIAEYPSDTYIPMASPTGTSHPLGPHDDTYPLVSISSSNPFSHTPEQSNGI